MRKNVDEIEKEKKMEIIKFEKLQRIAACPDSQFSIKVRYLKKSWENFKEAKRNQSGS